MEADAVTDMLTAQGVTLDIADGDLIDGAVVVAKVLDPDGTVSVVIGISEGMSWLEELGLVAAARDILRQEPPERRDDL